MPITMAEVETAIHNTNLRKGLGPDGILPEILGHGGSALRSFLFAIFNLLSTREDLPSLDRRQYLYPVQERRSQSMWKLHSVPRVNSCPGDSCCCVKLDSIYQASKIAEIFWVNQQGALEK